MGPALPLHALSAGDLAPILAVASKLAAPFDLDGMLGEVVKAALQVLRAERVSVWLHDEASDELVLRLAGDLESVRIPAGTGLVGTCARERRPINVPDCYADPRFDPSMDRRTGFRTRCVLTQPLVDHQGVLVGVMQVLNKVAGAGATFDEVDEALATVLAAQCAVALQRVRMTAALLEGERLRQELELARVVQRGTLPSSMPAVPGYDLHGTFEPASLTGGDTYDVALLERGLLVVLGDATGHGMGPALSVAQLQAMLRMAFRLGADLETAFLNVNNVLAEALPPDRFVTAFIGILDPAAHRMRYLSAGQGPILVFRARGGELEALRPTGFPLAAMPLGSVRPAATLELGPGDVLVLLSDGFLEWRNAGGEEFGTERVAAVLRESHARPAAELAQALLRAARTFAGGASQEDDVTAVLVKREAERPVAEASFERELAALDGVFEFVGGACARHGLDAALRRRVEFAVEELFTNMVKYGKGSSARIRVALAPVPGGVEGMLVDRDVDRFDPSAAPPADVSLPAQARAPGGLGLHLVRRLVDAIGYAYRAETRESRITFRVTSAGPGQGREGDGDVRDR